MADTQTAAPPARPGQEATGVDAEKAAKAAAKKAKSEALAEKRTNKVLEDIRLVSNLASPNYALTPEQKKEIVDAISNANAELETQFEQSYTTVKQTWHFAD